MPKRTAIHRGPYKAKSKPAAPMPLLLRRALAQLRGDPPESWPNATRAEPPEPAAPYPTELYGLQWPFPTITRMSPLPSLLPGLTPEATQAELRQMLERLNCAPLGTAWRKLEVRCLTEKPWPNDPGLEVLLALIEGLASINLFDVALARRAAAREILRLLEAFAAAGAPLTGTMPREPTALPGIPTLASTLDFMGGTTGQAMPAPPTGGWARLLYPPLKSSAALDFALRSPEVLLALLRDLGGRDVGTVGRWKTGSRAGPSQAKRASDAAHSPRAALSRYRTASRGDLRTSRAMLPLCIQRFVASGRVVPC